MTFALSTSWNARRHEDGEAVADEILALGFDALELSYHTTEQQVAGFRRRVAAGALRIDSVHAVCPVPVGAPHGYPELYLLASEDEDERAMASMLVGRTLDFAVSLGAVAVVLHAGRIRLSGWWGDLGTRRLIEGLARAGEQGDASGLERLLGRARKRRTARARRMFDGFCLSLDALLPKFERAGAALCLENLPAFEAFPDAREMLMLKERFDTQALAYWHDLGHGQVREYLGWESHVETARALLPVTRGVHLHDARPLLDDHLAPGEGEIDFSAFSFYGTAPTLRVFEPAADTPGDSLSRALADLRRAWGAAGVTAERPQ